MLTFLLSIVSMVLVPWGVLANGNGIQGQRSVALHQGSEITAGFHYMNCISDILSFRLFAMNIY